MTIDDAAYKLAARIMEAPQAYSPTEVNLARALRATDGLLSWPVLLGVEAVLAHDAEHGEPAVTLARTVRGLCTRLAAAESELRATLDRLLAEQAEFAALRGAVPTPRSQGAPLPYDPPTFAAGLGVVTAQLTAVAARIAAQVPGATPDPDDLAILANCGDALSRAAAEVSRG